ncbi:MAG: aminotransferase class V-fold PLP-dependent enzyme [Burkholderiales bacterium]
MNQPSTPLYRITDSRPHFPGAERWTYLDLGGRGLLSNEVRAAIDAQLDDNMYNGGNKDLMFQRTRETRERFAELIHAAPGDIAYTKNISDGLNMVAAALDWSPGDNVIVCADLEHPSNLYPWLNQQRRGLTVKMIKHRDGHMPVDDMIAAIDDKTRVLTTSTVSFSPGFRTDIDRLGKACRDRGVLFLVDAAQSAGVVDIDVVKSQVDALSVSTQKGLLGLYGMGFLYLRKEWADRMQPAYLARFGVDLGDAHESEGGDGRYSLMPGAHRFDLGNYNYVAIAAAHASLGFLLRAGVRNIETHTAALGHSLANGLLDLGLPVCGGRPDARIVHTVTVGDFGSGSDKYTSNETINGLYQHLVDNKVKLSMRRGVMRFSFHVYNNAADVERVIDLSRDFLKIP